MSDPSAAALRFLLEEARHVLAVQIDAINAFDEKASTLLRFNVLLVPGLVTLASVGVQLGLPVHRAPLALAGFVAGIISLLASTLSAIIAYRNLQWTVGLRSESLRQAMGYDATETTLLKASLNAYTSAMARNASRIEGAVDWLDRALATLMFGLVLLVGGSIALWWMAFP